MMVMMRMRRVKSPQSSSFTHVMWEIVLELRRTHLFLIHDKKKKDYASVVSACWRTGCDSGVTTVDFDFHLKKGFLLTSLNDGVFLKRCLLCHLYCQRGTLARARRRRKTLPVPWSMGALRGAILGDVAATPKMAGLGIQDVYGVRFDSHANDSLHRRDLRE
ncbi:hypothetical protein JOB18_015013 [Solea senegalensis]|uniref:Uncharacterized protein n=1 Tax=Solea senegalensis TaxID=28829 RepID=A0AAV6SY88_SOLSE|nr:hypothetical protein JOB18_015013 [Solea senegalensis]